MANDNEVKSNMARGGGVIIGALLGTVAVKVAEATFDHFFYKKERAELARRAGERLASLRLMSSMTSLRIRSLSLLHEGKIPSDAAAHIEMLSEASARIHADLSAREGVNETEEAYFKEKIGDIKRLSDDLDQTLKSMHEAKSPPVGTVVEGEVITTEIKEEIHVERTTEEPTARSEEERS